MYVGSGSWGCVGIGGRDLRLMVRLSEGSILECFFFLVKKTRSMLFY